MSGTSNYTTEQRIAVSAWTHEGQQTGKTKNQVRYDLQQRFGQEALPKQTFLRWKHKRFTTGNIKDNQRTGRLSARQRQWELVKKSLANVPQRLAGNGISRSRMQKHRKVKVKLHPHRRTFIQELTDMDINRREDACARKMIEILGAIPHVGRSLLVMNVTYTEGVDQ
jgi:hypothetical protein